MHLLHMRWCATVKKVMIFLLLARCHAVFAAADRTQLPAFFQNSYIGFSAGYADFGFTDANLESHLHSTSIQKERISLKVYGGHYFNPYLAVQLSLMRPIYWVKYQGVYSPDSSNSVWMNILSLTLRPTWPINDTFMLYGELGTSYISRTGFNGPDSSPGVKSAGILTPLTGAGVVYRFTPHWHLDASANVAWPNQSANQPSILHAALGLYYLFSPSLTAPTQATASPDYFPLQVLEFGFFERRWFNLDPTKILSNAYVPLFFQGSIKAQSGYYLMYERNVYHTKRWISLDWGVSAGGFLSTINKEKFYTFAVFPALRFWPLHSAFLQCYFTVSLAGPSYLSHNVIDRTPTGGHFTFQDYLGVGAIVGKSKRLNVNLKLLHYSNGNLLPHNPGIATPLILNLGYAW